MRNAQHWMDRANTTLPISHQSPQISSCFPPTSQTRLSIRLSRVPIFSLICYQRYQQHLFHKDSINRDYVEVGRWLTYNMTTSSSVLDIAIIKCLCFKCTDSSNIRVIIGYKKSWRVKVGVTLYRKLRKTPIRTVWTDDQFAYDINMIKPIWVSL